MVVVLYILVGILSGTIAGLLGVGGGVIIVPAMIFLLGLQATDPNVIPHVAIGSSLAVIVLTAVASTLSHQKRSAVIWRDVGLLSPGLLAGGLLAAFIASLLNAQNLKIAFTLFLLFIAAHMLLASDRDSGFRCRIPAPAMPLAGLIIGSVSALVGVGGGAMAVPLLLWCGRGIRKAVGTSAACTFPVALSGAAGFMLAGREMPGLPMYATGFIYWPAVAGIALGSVLAVPLGAKLAHQLPKKTLTRLFALLLIVVAVLINIGRGG